MSAGRSDTGFLIFTTCIFFLVLMLAMGLNTQSLGKKIDALATSCGIEEVIEP